VTDVRPIECANSRNCSNSIEHFPYTARRRWHIDVAQSNATVESVDDSVDDSRRRADSAGLTRTLDAQRVGFEGTLWVEKARTGHRRRAAWRSP